MILTSGGFDLFHTGHLRLLRKCRDLSRRFESVVVMLNSDEWVRAKKGYVVFPYPERAELLLSLRYVDRVVPCPAGPSKHETAAELLIDLKPRLFVKGGDRVPGNLEQAEIDACAEVKCQLIWGASPVLYSSTQIGAKLLKDNS